MYYNKELGDLGVKYKHLTPLDITSMLAARIIMHANPEEYRDDVINELQQFIKELKDIKF